MRTRIDKREYSRLAVALIVLGALSGGYVFMSMTLTSMQQDVQAKKHLVHSTANQESSGRSIEDVLRRTEASRSQLSNFLVHKDNRVAIFEQMEMIAETSQVNLKKELPERGDDIIFQLTATGSFANVMYFLRLVETMPYRVVVENSSIQKIRLATDLNVAEWKGSFDVTIYAHNLNQ